MTSETRTLIEFRDVMGVEIACPECKITTIYPLLMESLRKIGAHCSHCNYQFFDMASGHVAGPEAYPALSSLHGIIGNLSRFTQPDRTDIHAQIRLRINVSRDMKQQ